MTRYPLPNQANDLDERRIFLDFAGASDLLRREGHDTADDVLVGIITEFPASSVTVLQMPSTKKPMMFATLPTHVPPVQPDAT